MSGRRPARPGRPRRIVVVGGDAAGMSAAHTALRAARAAEEPVEITVLEATQHTSYSACGLPYWIAGEVGSGDDLVARTPEQHRAAGLDLRLGTRATRLDLVGRRVEATDLAAGTSEELPYDDLVLATGAVPVVPAWAVDDGRPVPGVRSVRNLDDGAAWLELLAGAAGEPSPTERDSEQDPSQDTEPASAGLPGAGRIVVPGEARRPERAVVVGGGYIGVEMAEALLRRGLAVTLVTRGRVLGGLEPGQSDRVEEGLRTAGVTLHCGSTVEHLHTRGDGHVSAAVLGDGTVIGADVVVLAAGVRPGTDLGRAAGIPLGERGGYLPDAGGRIGPGLWAAGDCCEVRHRLTGGRVFAPLGTHANKLGRVVGDNLLGADRRFGGALGTAITRFSFGEVHLEIGITGLSSTAAAEAGFDPVDLVTEGTTASGYLPEADPIATSVVADRATRRLLGVQVVGGRGAGKRVDAAAAALWGSLTVDDLAGMDISYAPPFATVWDALQIAARRLADRF